MCSPIGVILLSIHNCCSKVLVCHFEMFAVGVRCLEFLSTREANSYFEEEVATASAEEQSVYTYFCQWLQSISSLSNFVSNIIYKNISAKSYHTLYRLRTELTTNSFHQKRAKLGRSQFRHHTRLVAGVYFDGSLAFFMGMAFLALSNFGFYLSTSV